MQEGDRNENTDTIAAKRKNSLSNDASDAQAATPREPGTRRKPGLTCDELKLKGNEAFKEHKYDEAIDFFGRAISLVPSSHIYYSNRSAAHAAKALTDGVSYSNVKKHSKLAILDAKKCVGLDRKFAKGYVRWATGLMVIRDFKAAVRVLKRGLEAIPNDELLTKHLVNVKEKFLRDERANGKRRKKSSGFRIGEEDTEEEKRRKEELMLLRRQFLNDSKKNEENERQRLLKEEGIILPKANIMGAPAQSGFQPFADAFAIKHKRRKRKRKKISAHD
eukprot:CAMPEP_0184495374 /NCGR_PEP_ID=MMETSP0113_2-20130426/31110_1 /TAXON_ID=91329 /ORGANISM="Norrisiella sphaerica, Strain BC52" /LENGTH=276 /DNA_ID=CAMNT_0026881531 /DNA_START=71 /DNA_END=901 /DNA_ORIENTATION=-